MSIPGNFSDFNPVHLTFQVTVNPRQSSQIARVKVHYKRSLSSKSHSDVTVGQLREPSDKDQSITTRQIDLRLGVNFKAVATSVESAFSRLDDIAVPDGPDDEKAEAFKAAIEEDLRKKTALEGIMDWTYGPPKAYVDVRYIPNPRKEAPSSGGFKGLGILSAISSMSG